MQQSFQYGTQEIHYELSFSRRKTIKISVQAPDAVAVVAPIGTKPAVVLEKVRSKAGWITEKLAEFKDVKYAVINKEYVNGESFLYLGRRYSLLIHEEPATVKPAVKLYRGKLHVYTPTQEGQVIRTAIENWYKEIAFTKFNERIAYYQHYFPTNPVMVKIKDQKSRWASCTSKNALLFNWRIVMAPAPVLDYVVVHEMCHMIEKNHSRDFWELVDSIIPDYKTRREWLKRNGVRLTL